MVYSKIKGDDNEINLQTSHPELKNGNGQKLKIFQKL